MCTGIARSSMALSPRYMARSRQSAPRPWKSAWMPPAPLVPPAASCCLDLAASIGKHTTWVVHLERTPARLKAVQRGRAGCWRRLLLLLTRSLLAKQAKHRSPAVKGAEERRVAQGRATHGEGVAGVEASQAMLTPHRGTVGRFLSNQVFRVASGAARNIIMLVALRVRLRS